MTDIERGRDAVQRVRQSIEAADAWDRWDAHADWAEIAPSMAVATVVAAIKGVAPNDLRALGTDVETAALDRFIIHGSTAAQRAGFRFADYQVYVTAAGDVTVYPVESIEENPEDLAERLDA